MDGYNDKNLIETLLTTINTKTCVIIALAVGCTILCYYTNTTFDMDMGIVSVAVVFPLVFTINSAFVRREQALQHLAHMQANALSIRLAHYHFLEGKFLGTDGPKQIDIILQRIFDLLKTYFVSEKFSEQDYLKMMELFAAVSWSIEINLRRGGVPPPNISRVNESLRSLMQAFELLRNLKIYRTPLALRAYTRLFVTVFPILYSPRFAYIAQENNALWGALVLCVLYTLILSGLDAIQDGLEEPFDGEGIDDVQFSQYLLHISAPVITPDHNSLSFDKNGNPVVTQHIEYHHEGSSNDDDVTSNTLSLSRPELTKSNTIGNSRGSRPTTPSNGVNNSNTASTSGKNPTPFSANRDVLVTGYTEVSGEELEPVSPKNQVNFADVPVERVKVTRAKSISQYT